MCQVAQMVKNCPAMQESWIRSLGWEDPLEKGYSPVFPGKKRFPREGTPIPVFLPGEFYNRGAYRVPVMVLQRVGHDWATNTRIMLLLGSAYLRPRGLSCQCFNSQCITLRVQKYLNELLSQIFNIITNL